MTEGHIQTSARRRPAARARRRASWGAVAVATLAAAGGAVWVSSSADAGTVTLPPQGARFDYQLGGAVGGGASRAWPAGVPEPSVVSRDSTASPWAGKYSICYVNAFQSQPGDSSLSAYYLRAPSGGGSRGSGVSVNNGYQYDTAWGEYLLDIRGSRQALVAHFDTVMASCASRGFQAVEFDNLDTYTRDLGGLEEADAVAYAGDLVAAAHRNGLAAAQKNAAEMSGSVGFDFAVSESCLKYSECSAYTSRYAVTFDIEYSDEMSQSTFRSKAGAQASAGSTMAFEFRDKSLSPSGVRDWVNVKDGVLPTVTSTSSTDPSSTDTSTDPSASDTSSSESSSTSATSTTTTATRTTSPTRRPGSWWPGKRGNRHHW